MKKIYSILSLLLLCSMVAFADSERVVIASDIASNVTYSIDCCYSSDFDHPVAACKSSEACLHGPLITFHLADCSSCPCAVVAVGKDAVKCVLNSLNTHADIRKSLAVSYRQIVKRSPADYRNDDVISDIKSDPHFRQLSHYP